MQEYLEAIHSRVCAVCNDGILNEYYEFVCCGLPRGQICPVRLYLPEVLETIQSIDSPWMEDYVAVLRHKIGQRYGAEESKGEIRLRPECSLDTYFMLLAEAIAEIKERKQLS